SNGISLNDETAFGHFFDLTKNNLVLTITNLLPGTLYIQVSYYILGAIRKKFNTRSRREGEPLSPLSLNLQKSVFGLSRFLDHWLRANRDHTLMVFRKKKCEMKA